MKLLLQIFLGVAIATAFGADGSVPPECGEWPLKAPWEWTDEERLGRRSDESCREARRAQAAKTGRSDGSCQVSGNVTDFVFGTDTPELFLSWQLFDTLLRRICVANAAVETLQRQLIEERLLSAGVVVPEQFWQRLETAAGPYVAMLRRQREVASKLDTDSPPQRRARLQEITELQDPNCAARMSALEATRAAFEGDLFERILFTAVAPGLCSSGELDPEMIRWVGRGCPGQMKHQWGCSQPRQSSRLQHLICAATSPPRRGVHAPCLATR